MRFAVAVVHFRKQILAVRFAKAVADVRRFEAMKKDLAVGQAEKVKKIGGDLMVFEEFVTLHPATFAARDRPAK